MVSTVLKILKFIRKLVVNKNGSNIKGDVLNV